MKLDPWDLDRDREATIWTPDHKNGDVDVEVQGRCPIGPEVAVDDDRKDDYFNSMSKQGTWSLAFFTEDFAWGGVMVSCHKG